jgi:ATP-binding cassette subfamily F protein uup
MIMGQVTPDQGTIDIGPTVKIGYYAQEIGNEEMRPDVRVIDYIKDVAEYVQTEDGVVTAAKMLENFLFNGEMQYSKLEKLSGGERRRLYLCKVLMGAPNVLILDEPTNDLDISTLQILEDYLDRFQGIVMTVSHDRYFLDRVVRRIFSFEEGGELRQHEGGYTDYALRMAAENAVLTGNIAQGKSETTAKSSGAESGKKWNADRVKKLKFTYQEAKEYETIESDIAALEDKIEKLESDMMKFATDFVKLREITEEKEKAELLLEEKMDRWMYLEDLAKRIAEQ